MSKVARNDLPRDRVTRRRTFLLAGMRLAGTAVLASSPLSRSAPAQDYDIEMPGPPGARPFGDPSVDLV